MFNKCRKIISLPSAIAQCINKRKLQSLPDFTKDVYKVQRGPYTHLQQHHVVFFRDLLGESNLIIDISQLEKYNVDFMKHLRGQSTLVLRPKTTKEVSQILSYCNDNLLAVCPQGGNTGISGGGNSVFDEIVISTELMNNILHLDETSGVLICEAGCILENLDRYLNDYDLMTPIDLGAKGSCHIGGNVATNAGGIRLYRYGNLHGNILGLEVVKANGEVLDCLSTLKKDNTGFHLKHLFIGSEGCLGFITKVAIQCPPKPKSIQLAFLGAQNFTKVLKAFTRAKQDLGEIISAIEVMDHESMKLVEDYSDMSSPIGPYPLYLILETSGSDETHDQEKLDKYFQTCMDKHFILNGMVTSSPAKKEKIWAIREKLGHLFHNDGYVLMYDISLPLEHYYAFVSEMKEYIGDKSHRVFGFGHLGDGNLHFQVSIKAYSAEIVNYIEPYVNQRIKELKGSISAEHGIGILKKHLLPMVKSETSMSLMRDLKKIMDPNGILNPYKVI